MVFSNSWSLSDKFAVCMCISNLLFVTGCTTERDDNRSSMLEDIFKGYDNDAHPRAKGTGPVIVTFGAKLVRLIELVTVQFETEGNSQNEIVSDMDRSEKERANTLQTQWWIQQSWQNSRLSWNKTKYGEDSVNVGPVRVWTPDILLYNSGETSDRLAGGVEKYKTKVQISSAGYNKWYAPAMFKSTCDIDPQYFPFDDQHCKLQFGSWSFDQTQLDIIIDQNETGVKRDIYQENSEWELVELKAERFVKIYTCCPDAYPSIILHLHLRRRSKYYLVNLVIPCSLIAAMILLSFVLPPESGERIGLGITVLMAMAIFQELTSEKLPVDSKNIPLLANYYATGIAEIGVALIATAFIINFHHRKTKMPAWFRKIIFGCFGKLVMIKGHRSAQYNPVSIQLKELPQRKVLYNGCACGKFPESKSLSVIKNEKVTSGEEHHITRNLVGECKCENSTKETAILNNQEEDLIPNDVKSTDDIEHNAKEWQSAAKILDRVVLVVGLLVSIVSVTAIFLQAPRVLEMLSLK